MEKELEAPIFEGMEIRRAYDENGEEWLFSVVDIIRILPQQPDFQAARKYWNKLKERLKKEGSQSVTNCHRLKLEAADGKKKIPRGHRVHGENMCLAAVHVYLF